MVVVRTGKDRPPSHQLLPDDMAKVVKETDLIVPEIEFVVGGVFVHDTLDGRIQGGVDG